MFVYYTGQITHICGPDAALERQFATSGDDPPHVFTEGETQPFLTVSDSPEVTQLVNGSSGTMRHHCSLLYFSITCTQERFTERPNLGWQTTTLGPNLADWPCA